MFYLLGWLVFGLVVGVVARKIHPGQDPVGFFPTLVVGLAGSFIGGLINYIISGTIEFRPAGILMSVIGAVLFFALLRWLALKNVE